MEIHSICRKKKIFLGVGFGIFKKSRHVECCWEWFSTGYKWLATKNNVILINLCVVCFFPFPHRFYSFSFSWECVSGNAISLMILDEVTNEMAVKASTYKFTRSVARSALSWNSNWISKCLPLLEKVDLIQHNNSKHRE